MGRHRTARAKDKMIRDPKRKLSSKRNRDLKYKKKRISFQKSVTEKARANQALYDSYKQIAPSAADLAPIKKGINEKYLNRVKNAQSTYDSMITAIDNSQAVIEILDARDPYSFRFLDIEGEAQTENKPLLFLINKIDFVPQSVVQKWIETLTPTAPTFAVCLSQPETCVDLINFAIATYCPNAENIAVVGAPEVGKTTLCNLITDKNIVDTEKWLWTLCGNSLGLTNSVPWRGRVREFIVDTFERLANDAIFSLLSLPKQDSIGNLFADYAKKNGLSKQEVPEFIMNKFIGNEWKWYADAPEIEKSETEFQFHELQQKAFAPCPKDTETIYIILGPGTTVQMDRKALEFQIPEEEQSSDVSDDQDEEEEEQAEQ